MNLHLTQSTLFKLYLDPGYRLAHRFDPEAFAAHFGLTGEDADVITNVSLDEIADFAASLHRKRLLFLESSLPTSYGWVHDNATGIITEFLSTTSVSRSTGTADLPARFLSFLRESSHFYGSLPEALPEVGELELMLTDTRRNQRPAEPDGGDPGTFSWEDVVWRPESTLVRAFSTDPLPIVLKKREMHEPGEATNILVAPATGDAAPTVLRLARTAVDVLDALTEPQSARDLLGRCERRGQAISAGSVEKLLTGLIRARAVRRLRVSAAA